MKQYQAAALATMATLGWMAMTWLLLGSSQPPVPPSRPQTDALFFSLIGHLLLFGVLGSLVSVSAAFIASGRLLLNLGVVALVGVLWAISTELYQATVPGRDADLADVLVNIIGACAGGVVVGVFQSWNSHRLGRNPRERRHGSHTTTGPNGVLR
jgi:VanZ family protein